MSITHLQIKNFRSIANLDSPTQGLNIFVGQNDEGKSNVLRALDLFFTGDSRHGFVLDWNRDYCAFAPVRKNKAEEISITVEITPPATFKNRTPLRWTKVWRKEGLLRETMRLKSREKIPSKSKIVAYAKALRYDYVPAIKGEDYFQSLMANLHDMLESTVEEEVRRASQQFTSIINENTRTILRGILEKLSLESEIALPDSLRDIFAQLEFVSSSDQRSFSLSQRGDGIKVRHIPIV
nr:AAA family ATPase [Spirochaeta sp.]